MAAAGASGSAKRRGVSRRGAVRFRDALAAALDGERALTTILPEVKKGLPPCNRHLAAAASWDLRRQDLLETAGSASAGVDALWGIAARIHSACPKPRMRQALGRKESSKKKQLLRCVLRASSLFSMENTHLAELAVRDHQESHVPFGRKLRPDSQKERIA